jgi:hypothetical protein
MKNLMLSAVTVLLFVNNGIAQQYVPIIQPSNKWLYIIDANGGASPTYKATALQLQTAGDTSLNSITYTKVKARILSIEYAKGSGTPAFYNNTAGFPDTLFALTREDNKKVYIRQLLSFYDWRYQSTDTTEQLRFDFSLNIGDVSPMGKINNIDSVMVGTTYRKRFQTQSDTIVEGIGSMYDGLYSYKSAVHVSVNYLCYGDNSVTVSSTNKSSPPCFYLFPYSTPTSVKNTIAKDGISVYPNPMQDELTIKAPSAVLVSIYNTTGQLVLNHSLQDEIKLSTFMLQPSMYFLVLKNKDNNVIHAQKLLKQ